MPVLHPQGLGLNRSLAIQSPQTVHCTQSRLLSGIPRLLPTPVTTALVLLFRPCLLVPMAICLSFNLRIEENTNLIFLFVFRKGCDNIPWTRRGGLPIPRERNSHSYRAVALKLVPCSCTRTQALSTTCIPCLIHSPPCISALFVSCSVVQTYLLSCRDDALHCTALHCCMLYAVCCILYAVCCMLHC